LVTTEDGYYLASISPVRRLHVLSVTALRVAVCIALGIYGTQFLVNTISLSDLILNCVALEVVLNVDEILFSAFAPAGVIQLVGRLAPITKLKLGSWRGLDFMTAFWAILLPVLMLTAYNLSVQPIIDTICEARTQMCGGFQHFVYARDSFGLIFSFSTAFSNRADKPDQKRQASSAYADVGLRDPMNSSQLAVEKYIWNHPSLEEKMVWPVSSFARLETFAGNTIPETTATYQALNFATCTDLLGEIPGFEKYLYDHTHGSVGQLNCSSAKIKSLCSSSAFIRAICPIACGCDDPLSNLFLSGTEEGCPRCNDTPRYIQTISQAACADEAPGSAAWHGWSMQIAASAGPVLGTYQGGLLKEKMLSLGCSFEGWYRNWTNEQWGFEFGVRPCSGVWLTDVMLHWRPWATRCPETCGCNKPNVSRDLNGICPRSCSVQSG